MDRLMERFCGAVEEILGPSLLESLPEQAPSEMQGLAGQLRGTVAGPSGEAAAVRLLTAPWSTDERWQVMVQGREHGPELFWGWLADAPLCRIPFLSSNFTSSCSACGSAPCVHGAALTYHWLLRVQERPRFLLLLLNRRGANHHPNVSGQPIVRVPVVLGTNLERTRRELAAILDSAFTAAGDERDNLFGGDGPAPFSERR